MTSLVDHAHKRLGRGSPDLADRLAGLRRAVEACRGRLAGPAVEQATEVVERVESRLRLSGDHTVVVLAGATGSGKSSTFNALTGLDLAAIGVRRPTTSWTMSCTWGTSGSEELLDWLEVPARHRVTRNSMLDHRRQAEEERDLSGLVLLDLPDHDSTEVAHHVEVDRLVSMSDLLVWVLDPQKYADAAIHDRYLRPLAEHRDVLLVVLNHIDEVPEDRRPAMLEDLERLLEADGLAGVPVIATSARYGHGVGDLKKEISLRVRDKKAAAGRALADVTTAARRLQELCGAGPVPAGDMAGDMAGDTAGREPTQEMVEAFADAAGVPTVVHAVEGSARRRARRATGWPVTSWLSKLRPDPLRRLHLDLGKEGKALTAAPRASLPELTEVQRARVDAAVRGVADARSRDLPRAWAEAVRAAAVPRLPDLSDALDRAISEVHLPVRTPLWCRAVQVLQWLLLAAAVCGAVWLASLGAGASMHAPVWHGFSVPAMLLVGAVVVGIALSVLTRGLVVLSARLRAVSTRRRLRTAVAEVTERLVVTPIETERAAYRTAQEALAEALR